MYIHLMESTSTPEKAEKAADTLLTLMPAAGHMVHMPGHIYQRVGRYADAIRSNQLAIAADEDYIAQCRAQGLYPTGYYPHNIHFLWFAATFDGQSKLAIDAARKPRREDRRRDAEGGADDRGIPARAVLRADALRHWDEMLKEPEPPSNAVLRAAWHYARGLSFVATNRLAEAAERSSSALQCAALGRGDEAAALLAEPRRGGAGAGARSARRRNRRGARQLRQRDRAPGEGRAPRRQPGLHRAVGVPLPAAPRARRDPAQAGRPAEAETVYWEDLRRNRENGWALFGLLQALRAQNKTDDAALVEARFKKAWARADVTLTASRFGRATAARRPNDVRLPTAHASTRPALDLAPTRGRGPGACRGSTHPRRRTAGRRRVSSPPSSSFAFDGWRWDYLHESRLRRTCSEPHGARRARREPDPELSHEDVSEPLHDRDRPLSRSSRHRRQQHQRRGYRPDASRCRRRDEVRDPMWWGGEPIWVTARARGAASGVRCSGLDRGAHRRRAARATGSRTTRATAANARVDQSARLARPAGRRERPTFLTLYFEDTDRPGTTHGPDSDEVREAIGAAGWLLGRLLHGTRAARPDRHASMLSSCPITGWPRRSPGAWFCA